MRRLASPHATAGAEARRRRAPRPRALPPWAWAAGKTGLHGLSIFGDLKYPADFQHFDYINPDAPKGGRMNFQPPYRYFNQSFSTFNTLNSFVLKGDAPPRMEMTFDTLMASAADEPDALYGLVAESVDVSDDLSTYTFHLRREARFNDGTPLTADDVAFSFMLLKEKGHPIIAEPLIPMVSVEAVDETVTVKLDDKRTRETILSIAGDLPIFSKAYYADAPVRFLLARRAARVRRLQGRRSRRRPLHRIPARRRLLGRRPAGQRRLRQLRHDPHRLLHRAAGGVRGLQEGRHHLPRGIHLDHLGEGVRLPGRDRRQGEEDDGVPDREAAVVPGLLLQQPAADASPTRARGWRSASPSTSNGRTPTCSSAPTRAPASLFGTSRIRRDRQARRGGARDPRTVPRRPAGRGFRRALRAAARPTDRAATGRSSSRPPTCSPAAGWKQMDNALVDEEARAARRRDPDRRAGLRAHPVAVGQQPEGARHHRDRSARSIRRNTPSASTPSTST